jgi:L-alanine-DL-glutamate epimerase-like enolase superfamily enzyme
VAANVSRIDANPAAWCAIELALLDVIGKEKHQSLETLLSVPPIAGPFQYTAVLGAENPESFATQLGRYLQIGFRDFKVKLSADLAANQARLRALNAHADAIASLRLDANNLWESTDVASEHLRALDRCFFAVEEPLAVGDYRGLRQLADAGGMQIILDESFLRLEQFEQLQPLPGPWIINVRISKMGGLLRSLAVARRAAELNLPIVIGCQVGETSLLTRAALTLAEASKGNGLLAQEGAFGTYLLTNDIVDRPLVFGRGGLLDVSTYAFPQAAGFGLNVTGY